MLRGLPLDLCNAPVRHCVFKGVFLLYGNTASKIRTVKHLQDYLLFLQNMSVDALSRWPNFHPTFDVMPHDNGHKYLFAYIVGHPALRTCLQKKHVIRPLGFCYRHQQLTGSEFCTNFHVLAILAMCHFLRSLYCHNISVGNLQTLLVKGIIQFGLSDEGG
jgi:hypothetical protein